MSIEVIVLLLLIVANGVFSMSETAMISARKARLQQRAEEGKAGARTALEIAEEPTRFLSTVQIGITLIGILSGAFGGSTVARSIEPLIRQIAVLEPYSDAISVGVVVLIITYLSLVVGELVPKRLALNDAERIASLVAGPMNILSRATGPVVGLLTLSTNLAVRLLGIKASDEPSVTQQEVEIMLEQATEAGVFETAEQDIVSNLFRLGDWRVRAVMTPRTDMTWLDLDDSVEVNRQKIIESGYSYYPLFQKDMQHLMGVVCSKDVWIQQVKGESFDLQKLVFEPMLVPSSTPALKVLEQFRQTGKPIALLLDEQGDVEGLVTLVDLVEAMVGDIAEEDITTSAATQREDGSWLFDGLLNIDEIEDILHTSIFPEAEKGDYDTLGGFIMMRIGHIPAPSENFEWKDMYFEVMDMDGRRVDKVLVRPLQSDEAVINSED